MENNVNLAIKGNKECLTTENNNTEYEEIKAEVLGSTSSSSFAWKLEEWFLWTGCLHVCIRAEGTSNCTENNVS